MKRTVIATILCGAMLLALAGCAAASDEMSQKDRWLAAAKLDAEETPEELYEAALLEDTLVIYTDTSRMFEVKTLFEQAYPGLTVTIQDVRATDIIEMLRQPGRQTEIGCDLVCCPDLNAVVSSELVPQGILYKYAPYDIAPKILPEHNDVLLEFTGEGVQLFYHSGLGVSPVSNWWELTEPPFKGKIYMIDPSRSHTSSALLCTMVERSDEMLSAYFSLYGRELEVPEGSTAGQVFWEKMLHNEVQFTASSDEAIDAVNFSQPGDGVVAIAVSSKLRKTDMGYSIAADYHISPQSGVFTPTNIMVAAGAKNINAAKLFIRFVLGESDGRGGGNRPYLTKGAWPTRTDVTGASEKALSETNFWPLNKVFYAENCDWIMDWWLELRDREAAG